MRSRKTVCYICAMEGMKEKVISGEMSMGQYAEFVEKTEWLIEKTQHRKALACSPVCYDVILDIVRGKRLEKQEKKCYASRCNHTESKHPGGFACTAARCKCLRFVDPDNPTPKKTLQDSIAIVESGMKG